MTKTKRVPDRVLRCSDGDTDSYFFHPTRAERFAVLSEGPDGVAVMFVDRSSDTCVARDVEEVSESLMQEIQEWTA